MRRKIDASVWCGHRQIKSYKTIPKLLDVVKFSYISHMQKAIRRLCGRRVKLTTRLHQVPRLRMGGAIPLLSLYAFMSWRGITLLLPSSMNKNVAATRPDLGSVFNLAQNRLCGLVVRVSGYKYRGFGFDSRRYQIFWVVVGLERGPLSLVRSIEELLE